MLALCLSLLLAAPPLPALLEHVPRLQATSARTAQASWTSVKGGGSTKVQLAKIEKKKLLATACDDLVDLRALVDSGKLGPGFGFRDNVRGRSWARPSMALVLSEAMKVFRAEHPDRSIAIGDVSQPGCGQIAHGVLVQELRGQAALDLAARATWELGQPADVAWKTARDFPYEGDRFAGPTQRVRVAQTITAWSKDGEAIALRTGRTRHVELAAPSGDEVQAFGRDVQRLTKSALVEQKKITLGASAGGGPAQTGWLSHWVDEAGKRQLVLVTNRRPRGLIDFADVHEARLAAWQDKKPGSRPGELLWSNGKALASARVDPKHNDKQWQRQPVTSGSWTRWELMYEAGHITHLSGIDADLSYVTKDNRSHFAVDLEAMDVQATMRWWEIVADVSKKLGTPVDAILVDGSIERWVKSALPKKGPRELTHKGSRVWRLLARVGGHDGHHHLRIVEASTAQEKAARKKLGLVD